jgi:hypothetical protein
MSLPRAFAAPSCARMPATISVLAALALAVLASCDKSPGTAGTASAGNPPGVTATTSAATPSATTTTTSSSTGSGDWCALAERISTQSGVMRNKHFIPLEQETLDMFKAVVSLSLANRDALLAGLPDDVTAAVKTELQYYQALHDSNFSSTAPLRAGWKAAHTRVVKYQVEQCGFVYDK